jgi:hypothetical protein
MGGMHLRGRDRSRLLRVEGRLMCVLLGRLGRLGLAAWIPLCQALLLRLLTLVLRTHRTSLLPFPRAVETGVKETASLRNNHCSEEGWFSMYVCVEWVMLCEKGVHSRYLPFQIVPHYCASICQRCWEGCPWCMTGECMYLGARRRG